MAFLLHQILLALFLSLIVASGAGAATVAVFPVEDLSKGKNGVNFELTEHISQSLSAKGLEVVAGSEVVSFMARNRLRWLGYFDTSHILRAKNDLGADFLLFGTVCQLKEKTSPALGLSLYLVRTDDARTVWSDSGGLSVNDVQRLLGISEPKSIDDLLPLLTENVLGSWPATFEVAEMPLPEIDIESISLDPQYIKPGQQVNCRVRLRSFASFEERPQVFVKAGARVHLAMDTTPFLPDRFVKSRGGVYQEAKEHEVPYQEAKEHEVPYQEAKEHEVPYQEAKEHEVPYQEAKEHEVLYYEASWVERGDGPGDEFAAMDKTIQIAAAANDLRVLRSLWGANDEDDRYPVTLLMNYPSGKQRVAFLGFYQVDGQAPELELRVKGRKTIDGVITFNDKALFLPRMINREPIIRWEALIEDANGNVIVKMDGAGGLPQQFAWGGRQRDGHSVSEGLYKATIKAWDRAGNVGSASTTVAFRATPPPLELEAIKKDGLVEMGISYLGDVPLAFWRMEMWSADGSLVVTRDGSELPVRIEVPLPAASAKIEGVVVLRDILGNQTKKRVGNLVLLAEATAADRAREEESDATGDGSKESVQDSWVVDF